RGGCSRRVRLAAATPPLRPALDHRLAGALHGEGPVGHVAGDHRAGGDVGASPHPQRGDQAGVGADEGAVADHGAVLGLPVVVAGHRAGADVDVAAHVAVEDAGEVTDVTA